jgi:NADH-quinone oxidoreductase subunit L
MQHAFLWWIPLAPLVGSLLCAVLHLASLRARRTGVSDAGPGKYAGLVACAAMAVSLGLSVTGFMALLERAPAERLLESPAWEWITVADLRVAVSMVFDPLSSTMALVITGVGLLIHVYATGYMKGDPGYARFFAYLNLFVFAMLMLVLSSSLLGLFVGWEGVGLCSYLLIGFWYQKGWPAEAGQKAFVMNRIGDACFLLGSFLLVGLFGTLDLLDIGAMVPGFFVGDGSQRLLLALAALLLFGGCCGKSAQFPLFTWLPDAMAGPTPVSALIHAATMVTSGIYLIVRLNPLFAASPWVLAVISTVGALTAVIGATTALRQRDIKGVLAYSTVSQLGYMFLALGAGAFGSALFHVVTHAFFKALLFLGAGSVIHGMHEEQDMHKMGGLARHMPRTFVTFLCGAAALSGLPLLSGFMSKDEILAMTFGAGGYYVVLWVVGLGTAAITAFYSWRMVALTFYGHERFDSHHVHPHESPLSMTAPLFVLAFLSIAGGVLGLPPVIGELIHVPHLIDTWLAEVLAPGREVLALAHGPHGHPSHTLEWVLLGLGSVIALVFAHKGFHAHRHGVQADAAFALRRPSLAARFGAAWGIDAAYQRLVVLPVRLTAFVTAVVIDQFAIDGLVNGAGNLARALGERGRRAADGHVQSYALWIGAGAVLLSGLWMWS